MVAPMSQRRYAHFCSSSSSGSNSCGGSSSSSSNGGRRSSSSSSCSGGGSGSNNGGGSGSGGGGGGSSSNGGQLKCDGTRAETRFRVSAKRTSPFKSAEGVSSVDCWQPRCAHQR